VPQLAGKGTTGSGKAKNRYPERYYSSWPPTVDKGASEGGQEAVDEDVKGQHNGNAASAPTELIQNRSKED